jgi:hypothetical protein
MAAIARDLKEWPITTTSPFFTIPSHVTLISLRLSPSLPAFPFFSKSQTAKRKEDFKNPTSLVATLLYTPPEISLSNPDHQPMTALMEVPLEMFDALRQVRTVPVTQCCRAPCRRAEHLLCCLFPGSMYVFSAEPCLDYQPCFFTQSMIH